MKPKPPHPATLARRLIKSGDFAGASRCLEAAGDSEKVGGYFANLTKDLYAKKNVTAMLALGRYGVDYLLRQGDRMAAKTLAFNVAANCWPGWGDDGIAIDAAHIEGGLELAKLSLRQVQELELGGERLGTAFWLVGALELAANKADAALANFAESRASFQAARKPLEVLLAEGYRAIAQPAATDGADVQLAEVIAQLKRRRSQKARFFISQLQTAARILRERSSPPAT